MSGLFGIIGQAYDHAAVSMRRAAGALRRHNAQRLDVATHDQLHVGILQRPNEAAAWTFTTEDESHVVFVAGDVFSTRRPLPLAEQPDNRSWQRALVEAFRTQGPSAFAGLNGDFQLAVWDVAAEELSIAVDRFSTQPLYWTASNRGFAFAFGVRGVLALADAPATPDVEAIREAVTFGGYRLGTRTNVANVNMVRPAHAVRFSLRRGAQTQAYWSFRDIPPSELCDLGEALEAVHGRWRTAVARRLTGSAARGQTLSGGRDSRAILAEASPQCAEWTAITYGVPGCDDGRYAERAAASAGARWKFVTLYSATERDWLERRTAHIQHTDGLIDLVDLMHLENADVLTGHIQCHLPGYLGDVIVGTTYDHVDSYEAASVALSFTGAPIALEWNDARERLEAASVWTGDTSARALIFEHKFPQAIGRPNAALEAWSAVRRPFLDLDLVDLAIGLRHDIRVGLYDAWVRRAYPALFRRIPTQKTGAPAGGSRAQLTGARVARVLRRTVRRTVQQAGWPVQPWSRTFTADEREFSRPGIRERIESTILRPESLVCEVWGRPAIASVLANWFDHGQGSTQVIGALYSWEAYHRDLASFLRSTREIAS